MASQLPILPGQQPQQDQVPQVCTGGSGGRSHQVLPPNQELPVFMSASRPPRQRLMLKTEVLLPVFKPEPVAEPYMT